MLIELHFLDGTPVYVNPDHVCWLDPEEEGLTMRFVDGSQLLIQETAEEYYHLRTTAAGHQRLKSRHYEQSL